MNALSYVLPLSTESAEDPFPEPGGSYSPQGVVELLVERHLAVKSSPIQFTYYSLDIPG